MSHEYLQISTDNGKTWRELKDTETTETYITKLSYAAPVIQLFDTGEWIELECGKRINGGLRNCPGYENKKRKAESPSE